MIFIKVAGGLNKAHDNVSCFINNLFKKCCLKYIYLLYVKTPKDDKGDQEWTRRGESR